MGGVSHRDARFSATLEGAADTLVKYIILMYLGCTLAPHPKHPDEQLSRCPHRRPPTIHRRPIHQSRDMSICASMHTIHSSATQAEEASSFEVPRAAVFIAPVNRLPVELWREIFYLSVDEKMAGNEHACGHYNSALAISWTCSLWRDISLADPRIWRKIRLSSPDLTRLLLQRSEPLSLVACVPGICFGTTGSNKTPTEDVTLLDQVLPRSRAISFEVQTGDTLAWLETQAAPLLEELSISTVGPGTRMQKLDIHTLFAGHHPNLRSLELHGCYLPWHRGLYAGLTRLALSGPLLAQAPCADVLAVLAACPALAALSLQFASGAGYLGVMRHDGAAAPRARVPLPRLAALALRLPFYDTRFLLAGLALTGALRDVRIVYPSGELLHGLAYVRAALPLHTFPALHTLRVARTAPASFAIDGAGRAPGGEEYEMHVEAHVQGLLRDCATLVRALAEDGMPALQQVDVEDDTLGPEDLVDIISAVSLFQRTPKLMVNGAMCIVPQNDLAANVIPEHCL